MFQMSTSPPPTQKIVRISIFIIIQRWPTEGHLIHMEVFDNTSEAFQKGLFTHNAVTFVHSLPSTSYISFKIINATLHLTFVLFLRCSASRECPRTPYLVSSIIPPSSQPDTRTMPIE